MTLPPSFLYAGKKDSRAEEMSISETAFEIQLIHIE